MAGDLPTDLEQVREAFRLGWVVSELRGRCRPALFDQPLPPSLVELFPERVLNALPLGAERGATEVRVELTEGAGQLSKALALSTRSLTAIKKQRREMEKQDQAGRQRVWETQLNKAFYKWDAFIQDTLLLQATQAAAYQLGRGLADTYWALDPTETRDRAMTSCHSLLGVERFETLHRLTMRLSPYLGPMTVAAVTGSLLRWHELVGKLPRSQTLTPSATLRLYQQGLLWRDLIRGERLPQDLVDDPTTPRPRARNAWNDARPYWDALLALWAPLLLGLVGAAVLTAGAALLAGGITSSWLSTAISVAGGLGLTSATLYGRAKARIISLSDTFTATVTAKKVAAAADLTQLIEPAKRNATGYQHVMAPQVG